MIGSDVTIQHQHRHRVINSCSQVAIQLSNEHSLVPACSVILALAPKVQMDGVILLPASSALCFRWDSLLSPLNIMIRSTQPSLHSLVESKCCCFESVSYPSKQSLSSQSRLCSWLFGSCLLACLGALLSCICMPTLYAVCICTFQACSFLLVGWWAQNW